MIGVGISILVLAVVAIFYLHDEGVIGGGLGTALVFLLTFVICLVVATVFRDEFKGITESGESEKQAVGYAFSDNKFSYESESGSEFVINDVEAFVYDKENNVATLERENGDKYIIEFDEGEATITSANGEEKVIELEDLKKNEKEGEEKDE
ncbi:hypothetical protein M2150_001658 [Lachnospiraceae bacterium PM6-15]|uniref:hypothetical protein n=1 Tax=Ohessyouella blattaphilus TaxID=2949333 RepID=UPI003E2A908D